MISPATRPQSRKPTVDCYLFSRRDAPELTSIDPVSLAATVFFQMWRTRAFPYKRLSDGDVVYIGDIRTRRIHWEVRVTDLLADFGYSSPHHALNALRSAYGLYAADLNRYHQTRSGKGWLLAWSPTVMRHLRVPLPGGFWFGQNGYRLLPAEERVALGLPRPKAGGPLATPPPWYDPAEARSSERRAIPRYIPVHVRRAVAERDRYRCAGCGATTNLHLDHVNPHSHGGPSIVENLRIVCAASNLARGAGNPADPLRCAGI